MTKIKDPAPKGERAGSFVHTMEGGLLLNVECFHLRIDGCIAELLFDP